MQSLYDPASAESIKQRLTLLTPQSNRLWGKMTPAQTVAHLAVVLEGPLGDRSPPRALIGRLIGWMFKRKISDDSEWQKSSPTDPSYVVDRECDLDAERLRLFGLIDRFVAMGPDACSKHPHVFFGKLTGAEWGKGMYKHLDHHLRQFGV